MSKINLATISEDEIVNKPVESTVYLSVNSLSYQPGRDYIREIKTSAYNSIPPQFAISKSTTYISNSEKLNNISFTAVAGEITGILGNNLGEVRTLLGLIARRKKRGVFDGDITLNGLPSGSTYYDNYAFIPHKTLYIPFLSFYETLKYAARLHLSDKSPVNIDKRIEEVMEIMGLTLLKNRVISEFPSERGEVGRDMRLLSIAIEIMCLPALIIIDDPVLNLDPASRGHIVVCGMPKPHPLIFPSINHLVENMGYVFNSENELVDFIIDVSSGTERPSNSRQPEPANTLQEKFETSIYNRTDKAYTDSSTALTAFSSDLFFLFGYGRIDKPFVLLKRAIVILERAIISKFKDTETIKRSLGGSLVVSTVIGYLQFDQGAYGYYTMTLFGFPFYNTANVTAVLFFVSAFTFVQQVLNVHVLNQKLQDGYYYIKAFGYETAKADTTKNRKRPHSDSSIEVGESFDQVAIPVKPKGGVGITKPLIFARESSITSKSQLSMSTTPFNDDASKGPTLFFHSLTYKIKDSKSPSGYKAVLNNVSGQFDWGKLSVIIGAPQSGKSSLLHILAGDIGIRTDLTGDIFLNSKTVNRSIPLWQRCALVEAHDEQYRDLTVREIVYYAMLLRCINKEDYKLVDNNIKVTLEILHLEDVADKKAKHISPGERRRLSLAEEIVHGPSLVLIDEPVTNLSIHDESVMMMTCREMVNQDKTVIVSMQQISVSSFKLFDTILLLSKGRVIYHGSARNAPQFFVTSPYSYDFSNYSYNPGDFLSDISSGLLSSRSGDVSTEEYNATSFFAVATLFLFIVDIMFVFYLFYTNQVCMKELSRGLYTNFTSWLVANIPLYLLTSVNAVVYSVIVYKLVNLNTQQLAGITMAEAVVYSVSDVRSSYLAIPGSVIVQFGLSGLFIKSASLPGWLSWAPAVSMIRWVLQGNFINQFENDTSLFVTIGTYDTYIAFLELFGWTGVSKWGFASAFSPLFNRLKPSSSSALFVENTSKDLIGALKARGPPKPQYVLEQQNGAVAIVRTFGGNVYTWKTKDGIEILGKQANAGSPEADDKPYQGGAPHYFPKFNSELAAGTLFIQEERAKKLSFDRMIFKLVDTPKTLEVFPHKFEYRYDITLKDDSLEWEIAVINLDTKPFDITLGLNTFFDVSSLKNVVISGPFAGAKYIDRITGAEGVAASNDITITAPTDLLFPGLSGPITVTDSVKGTKTVLTRKGYTDTVIWNPYGNDALGYDKFVSIQPVSVSPVTIPVGKFKETHFSQLITASKI
eukprot:gene21109-27353_t